MGRITETNVAVFLKYICIVIYKLDFVDIIHVAIYKYLSLC